MSTTQRELVLTIIRVLVFYILAVVVFLISLYLGFSEYTNFSLSTVVKEMSEKTVRELEELVQAVLAEGPFAIFWRNFLHMLAMATPFVGCGYAMLTMFSTGFKAGLYLAIKYGVFTNPELVLALALALLSSPYAVLELASYALAVEAGVLLTYEILRKVNLNLRSVVLYASKLSLSTALLYIAAVLEYNLAATLAYS